MSALSSNVIPFRRRGTEPWLTKHDVARHIGRSERWIEMRIREDGLPCHKFRDRSIRFRLSEIDEWLKEREVA